MDNSYPHLKQGRSEQADQRAHRHRRDDLIRILGVPEARQVNSPEEKAPLPSAWAWVFVWIGVVSLVAAGFGLGWLIGRIDFRALLDLLAPTAAQVRDTGWIAISEQL
ncbi:hypothetical protein ACEUZ9_002940 [Paracoccus litorisediminis]|uniref:hypothetical protein n=1 Tax=Paracoccus litorisediminis TaxID=2006130 RepID=UPI00372EBD13